MYLFRKQLLLAFAILLTLTACGGGGGGSTPAVSSLELLDPTPGSDLFGLIVVQLANGNIVVSDKADSSVASGSGAVHLYSPFSSTPIASMYGDGASDKLGNLSITALGNSNYVIVSEQDEEGGIVNAGSVRLMNGTTGAQIAVLAGDVTIDRLGENGITVLDNNNYVIASSRDDEGGIVDAGSARLMNGTTGAQIAMLAGDVAGDFLSGSGVIALDNNNYVIASDEDDEGGIVDAGSVRLMNGTTGVQIAMLAGDVAGDFLGYTGVYALDNNNYVIASEEDDEGGVIDAGSVRLMNGTTGAQIAVLAGDVADDFLGYSGVYALDNNNYVIASNQDDEGGIVDAGSVRLMDGTTGAQIAMLAGDVSDDQLGNSRVTALDNNNYVIISRLDDEGGIVDAGSVRLVNGTTGAQIAMLAGDVLSDQLGNSGVTALDNNNYVIISRLDDEGGIVDAGSVRLMNGTTGVAIGAAIVGAVADDMFLASVTKPISGDYYILSQPLADSGGQVNAGMVRIVSP